jgi:hypothetical protein
MSETQAQLNPNDVIKACPEVEGQPLSCDQPAAAPVEVPAAPQTPGLLTRIFGEGGSLYTPVGVATATTVGVVAGIAGTLLVQSIFGGGSEG